MDKTYAETRGLAATDWPKIIRQLHAINPEEHAKYADLAWSWPTCAVGNACAIIPRHKPDSVDPIGGAPLDPILRDLGNEFARYIENRASVGALRCWQEIENRATEIVAQELAKLNAP